MSIFEGAVLVNNDKIRNALGWYRLVFNLNNKFKREVEAEAKEIGKNFTKWQKFWHAPEYRYHSDIHMDLFRSKYTKGFCAMEWGYHRAGIIGKRAYDLLMDHRQEKHDNTYSNLLAMVYCGEPVYLNPVQAVFVNKWGYKENK